MFIASGKRKTNIAEYLLYMWQIEDIIRANDLDINSIRRSVIEPMHLDADRERQLTEWYESLIDMMRREEVEKSGHLQINKNVLSQLRDIHNALLADPKFQDYSAEFYRTLPYIVELRAKAGDNRADEIETCFNALYGMLLLRLSGKEISADTQTAIAQIARFIALLSRNFHLDEAGRLFNNDEE